MKSRRGRHCRRFQSNRWFDRELMVTADTSLVSAEQTKRDPQPTLSAQAIDALATPCFLAGLYAWVVTCAPSVLLLPAVWSKGRFDWSALLASASAVLVLPSMFAGAWLARRRSVFAVLVGIWLVMLLCLGSWLAMPVVIDITRIDAMARGALGASGFVFYALAWGITRPASAPSGDLEGDLTPRGVPPRGAVVVMAIGVIGAAATLVMAWMVREPNRALFAHPAAALGAIGLISGAARVAVDRGGSRSFGSPRSRVERASQPLAFLAIVLAIGAALILVTR